MACSSKPRTMAAIFFCSQSRHAESGGAEQIGRAALRYRWPFVVLAHCAWPRAPHLRAAPARRLRPRPLDTAPEIHGFLALAAFGRLDQVVDGLGEVIEGVTRGRRGHFLGVRAPGANARRSRPLHRGEQGLHRREHVAEPAADSRLAEDCVGSTGPGSVTVFSIRSSPHSSLGHRRPIGYARSRVRQRLLILNLFLHADPDAGKRLDPLHQQSI